MKAQALKTILEIPFSIGKSFSPITEYIFINKNIVRATNLESYLEVILNEDIPFSGCVLKEPLQKFLNSIDKNTELTFEVNNNVLMILYGKKNKVSIPMEDLSAFPESPKIKYVEDSLVNSLLLTNELMENFERAIKFVSDIDSSFSGLFLKGKTIYSSNREIIYSGKFNVDKDYSVFIPKDLIKYVIKFKETFDKMEIHKQGFKVFGGNMTLYFPNFGEGTIPNFENIMNTYEDLIIIKNTEELKNCVNRIKQFDEVINITIKGNNINLFTNSINETVEFDNIIDKEYSFKFNPLYLKMILDSGEYVSILTKNQEPIQPNAIGSSTNEYKIVSAVII